MILSLTTWERVQLSRLVGQLRGNVALLRKAGRVLDAVELSEAEQEAVGFNTIVRPDGSVSAQWRDAAREFEVEIADREAAMLLRRTFQQCEDWRVADRALVEALAEKIEASQGEK